MGVLDIKLIKTFKKLEYTKMKLNTEIKNIWQRLKRFLTVYPNKEIERLYMEQQHKNVFISLVIVSALGLGFFAFYCGLLVLFYGIESIRVMARTFFIVDGLVLPWMFLLITLQWKLPQYMTRYCVLI
jgi:hypothetical protein